MAVVVYKAALKWLDLNRQCQWLEKVYTKMYRNYLLAFYTNTATPQWRFGCFVLKQALAQG